MSISIKDLVREFPRWESKVRVNPHTGCWEWLGALDPEGYGMGSSVKAPNTKRAHRVVYRVLVGDIPSEITLDHEVCEVRHCVNPHHLTPCSAVENVKRGAERRRLRLWQGPLATEAQLRRAKGICKRGHMLAEVGVLTRNTRGDVRCKACQHETQRKNREKNGIKTGTPRGAYGSRDPKRKKSKYKGVSWNNEYRRWFVNVYYKGKTKYGGTFKDEHEAGQRAKEVLEYLQSTHTPQ